MLQTELLVPPMSYFYAYSGSTPITSQELSALLSGIDLSQAKRRKRYERNS
jgi:hypothetical protein